MKAVSRLGEILLAGALVLAPVAALAQEAQDTTNTPAPATVGPRELQNFSLPGTVTRPSERPAPQTAPQQRQPRTEAQAPPPATQTQTSPAQSSTARAQAPASTPAPRRTETASALPQRSQEVRPDSAPEPLRQTPPASSVTVALPKLTSDTGQTSAAATPAAATTFPPAPASSGSLAPEHGVPVLPWLLAALALGAGGAFLFWRNRSREAFAGGPQVDAFVAPAPAPAPAPRPAPQAEAKAPPPTSLGVVSTRLRPWIDIGFRPLRCILDDERVVVEFELELFNSGSAPARAVLIEASLFNAGPNQDAELGAFFANPVGQGDRIVSIAPLKRVGVKTQVVAPRAQLQAYEMAGRQVFVPLIGFNALYRWSGGEGQTSVAYLLGRDTKGEKMGPFRLDLGPRIFRGIASRLLPTGVRD